MKISDQAILIDYLKYHIDYDRLRTFTGRCDFDYGSTSIPRRFFMRTVHNVTKVVDEWDEVSFEGEVTFMGRKFKVRTQFSHESEDMFCDDHSLGRPNDYGFEVVEEIID